MNWDEIIGILCMTAGTMLLVLAMIMYALDDALTAVLVDVHDDEDESWN